MNLEYKISLEYDIDLQQASWEYSLKRVRIFLIPFRYFPIFICALSIGSIGLGLFERDANDSSLLISSGFFLIIGIGLFFIYRKNSFLFSLNHNQFKKQWSEYYSQQNRFNIILTAKEFILKTNNSEKTYTWKALESLDEYSTGFIINFFDCYGKFIPKSAFLKDFQIHQFKQLVEQYQNNY